MDLNNFSLRSQRKLPRPR